MAAVAFNQYIHVHTDAGGLWHKRYSFLLLLVWLKVVKLYAFLFLKKEGDTRQCLDLLKFASSDN